MCVESVRTLLVLEMMGCENQMLARRRMRLPDVAEEMQEEAVCRVQVVSCRADVGPTCMLAAAAAAVATTTATSVEAKVVAQVTRPGALDAPIDLSQLSTRSRMDSKRLAGDSRSVSESCLALGRHAAASSSSSSSSFSVKFPARVAAVDQLSEAASPSASPAAESLKYRSMSNFDIARYRTPWLNPVAHEAEATPCDATQRRAFPQPSPTTTTTRNADSIQQQQQHPSEFLLRRTASESVLPSRSDESSTPALQSLQQQLMQQHYQQLLLQQQQEQQQQRRQHQQNDDDQPAVGAAAVSGADASAAGFMAPPWLYLGLVGYSNMLRSFQAHEYLRQMSSGQNSDLHMASDQVSVGAGSPMASPECSDVEGDDLAAGGSSSAGLQHKRRSPRALTGKHVRLGTGASQQTLNTLRQKLEERQRLKTKPNGQDDWKTSAASARSKLGRNSRKGVAKIGKKSTC